MEKKLNEQDFNTAFEVIEEVLLQNVAGGLENLRDYRDCGGICSPQMGWMYYCGG